jgi:hypothetical protein
MRAMNFSPKTKQALIQALQKQRDFKVELVVSGSGTDLSTQLKGLRLGQYTVIVIRN